MFFSLDAFESLKKHFVPFFFATVTPFSADLDQTTSRIPHSILLRGRREAFDLGASHQSHEIRRISREKVQF